MFLFEKSLPEHVGIEKSISDSNPFFNRISKGKEHFTTEEVLEEIRQAARMGAERFIVKEGTVPVAVLEYLMLNPKDQCTWLGLLQVKKEYHGKGYGTRILQQFEQLLRDKRVKKYRLGVIAENEPARQFWKKQGFQKVAFKINEDSREIIICEKELDLLKDQRES